MSVLAEVPPRRSQVVRRRSCPDKAGRTCNLRQTTSATRRSRTPTRGPGIERERRRNGQGAEGRIGWRQRRVSAGWIHSRDQAGRQSPAGHRSRAREGTRCVPAKKTPDDSRTAPMDEAFSPRFRCRASTWGKTCAVIGFRLAGKRSAASESMPGEARANRTGLVSVRLAIRASPGAIITRCSERPMATHVLAATPPLPSTRPT